MKQIYALIVMLMMASVAFTGCVSDDGDDTDVDDTVDPVGTESTSTLDTVIARGSLKCGVKDSQYGMGYLEADGTYTGLDIEYCKAVAAAIGVDTI
jgi:general L-amino acid transport system substrate-binding protein